MRSISVNVKGLSCFFDKGIIDNDLMARTTMKEKIHGGKNNGRFREVEYDVPIYQRAPNNKLVCGLGAILYLAKNNPFVELQFSSMNPSREVLGPIVIPDGILNSSKWKVNGKERWYFHEALEACRKAHCGTVRLATGSGKTSIELTLAYNQMRQLGSGIILVPNHTIKDQFIKSANAFGIPMVDYREWVYDISALDNNIVISTPKVVHNDIENIENWVRHQTTEDWRPVLQKLHTLSWIIGDEVHHAGTDTWNKIFLNLPNLSRSHGFSALPVSEETNSINFSGMSLEDALTVSIVGPVIYERSTRELKEFLNIPYLINLHYSWPKNKWADQSTDNWNKIRGVCKINIERTKFIADAMRLLILNGYNTIAHVGDKTFGIMLLEEIGLQECVCWYGGGEVITLSGSKISSEDLRKKVGTSIFGMICTSHAIEGLDLESPLDALMLIDGKKARPVIQKSGRIVRPSDRKSLIINLIDSNIWVLPGHGKQRTGVITDEFDCEILDIFSIKALEKLLKRLGRFET